VRQSRPLHRELLLAFCLGLLAPCFAQTGPAAEPAMNAEQVVAMMVAKNEARTTALRGYTGIRVYQLHYRGRPGNREAELTVEARYTAPSTKQFTVVSQSGSKFMIDKVLKRLLTSEQEALSFENRQQTALTPRNYTFEMAGREHNEHGQFYILKVHPKVKNKFLYSGKIWVDANDFAIQRIEGEPAKNPSFWITSTRVEHKYAKFGDFWLPVQNQSTSKIRLGGTATLLIDYQDYKLSSETSPPLQADGVPARAEKSF
jgi:hypothetical protein